MNLVNIPRSNTDDFYRYKMPVIKTKIEGKGNGIRTVIVNMGKVMKALDRPLEYGTKFIGFELGTQTKIDNAQDNCVVSGKHEAEALSQCLDKFIDTYILCTNCKNPETVLEIKKGIIVAKCKACGKYYKIDMDHKLSNHILKSEINKTPVSKNTPIKTTKVKNEEENSEKWSVDTSNSAVQARQEQLYCNTDEDAISLVFPIENFVKYIETNPDKRKFIVMVNNLKKIKSWSDNTLIRYLFAGLFSNNMRENFYKKVIYLEDLIITPQEMNLVLICMEKIIEENNAALDDSIHFINGLYETEIIDEDSALKWYFGKNKMVSQELSDSIKQYVHPFIEWLENAETDIDDS
jgi:translation initiation factor 5